MSPKKHTAVFKILHKYFMICPTLSRPSRVNQRIQGDSVVDGRATWLEYTREI